MDPAGGESLIFVVGSASLDYLARSEHIPFPGETLLAQKLGSRPGGKGANQAVAIARLGAAVEMVGFCGNDAAGKILLAALNGEGVGTRFFCSLSGESGSTWITLGADGQNSILVFPGANSLLSPADLPAELASAAWAVFQLETPLETFRAGADLVHQGGGKVILNAAPAMKLSTADLARVDLLVVNELEAATLTGLDLDSAAQILRTQVPGLVITLGAQGAYYFGEGQGQLPAFKVPVVDTTGAGDAFVGALTVALNEGKTLPEAVIWANAAGALATTKPGAQTGPTRAEISAMLNSG